MRMATILIVILAVGLLFVSACTTGQASYNPPQQYGGGGCGASLNPVNVLENTASAALTGNNGGC